MKLKQRILIVPLVFIGGLIFITIHQRHVIQEFGFFGEANYKPSLRDFQYSNDAYQRHHALDKSAPVRDQSADGLKNNAFDALKSHLIVPRKDLDVSNYSSKSDTVHNIHVDIQELKNWVLNDTVIQDNADTIIEIAHILEHDHHKTDQSKEIVDQHHKGAEKPLKPSNKEWETDYKVSDNAIKIAPAFRPYDSLLPEDEVMLRFELSQEVVDQLESYMKSDKGLGKTFNRSPGKKLDIHKQTFVHGRLYHWERFHNHINQHYLYDPKDEAVIKMIESMAKSDLVSYYQDERGTQLKLVFYLPTHQQAMFKPMRYPREQETLPDHFYFSDFERHNAEIAAFHLDMVFGFYRVPPTVGRRINVTYDVKRQAKPELLKTFFVSPAGNICFHGDCDYYCDTGHAVCGHPDIMEGSMQAYLPSSRKVKRKTWKHPWKRSYHKRNKADWETDNRYCSQVKHTSPYNNGRRLLDLMDMAVFDFIQGNMDRHHYETFETFGNYTYPILMDNGRGFGKARHDELSILAPLYQCCLIRYTTLRKLLDFHRGPVHLSDAMRSSMADDVAQPVLLEAHHVAMDRRVKIILKTIHKCIERNGYIKVVQNDGF